MFVSTKGGVWLRWAAATAVIGAVALVCGVAVSNIRASQKANEPNAAMVGPSHAYWSTMGASGMVDEEDLNIYKTRTGLLQIRNGAPYPAKSTSYYTVTLDPNVQMNHVSSTLTVRFKDDGDDARIVVKLKAYDTVSGSVSTLMIFDSNDDAPSDSFQTTSVFDNSPSWDWDFATTVYFVEGTVMRFSDGVNPALGSISLDVAY